MKKIPLLIIFVITLTLGVLAQFSFYLIDNFEDANITDNPRWWRFGDIKAEVVKNPKTIDRDLIAESCGEYALNLSGQAKQWYVGGIGSDVGVDGSRFSRFQVDIYGNKEYCGKLKIELFDDDNNNYSIEQDTDNNYEPTSDDKWVAEVPVLGKGFTRISIPFSAFRDANPKVGDDVWNPNQEGGSGGLLKMQLVAIAGEPTGKVDFNIDNLLLTY